MNHRTKQAIIRRWQFGFKVWAIAREFNLTRDDVLEILVDAGLVRLDMVQVIK